MYEKLRNDHRELLDTSAEIRTRVAAGELNDPIGLSQCRWRLARTVTQHLAVEDVHVYRKLASDPRPAAVAISARYERELGQLLGAFNAHIAEWPADAVRRDWLGYRAAITELLDALEARIQCEEHELYPLLTGMDKHAA